mgnify:CR=1 FL=1
MTHIKTCIINCLTLAALLIVSPAFSASDDAKKLNRHTGSGDPVAGKAKSQICQGCHGVNGNSLDEFMPKLAGQYDEYIIKQMKNYLAGIRSHEIMNGMASPLSDQDIADIGAYFSKQEIMKGRGWTNDERGVEIYTKGGDRSKMVMTCLHCHGERGKGLDQSTAMYPVIGGQHKAYLVKQMVDFREDDRLNSPNTIMNKIVRSLSDKDIEAVSEYLSVQ